MSVMYVEGGLNCHWEEGCEPRVKDGNAGIDLRAKEKVIIEERGVYTVKTGFYAEIPCGYCGFLLPRSGSSDTGFKLANTIGLIDPSYRGEIIAKVVKDWENFSEWPIEIEQYERICQLVIVPYAIVTQLNWKESLDETERGDTGFGKSGRF